MVKFDIFIRKPWKTEWSECKKTLNDFFIMYSINLTDDNLGIKQVMNNKKNQIFKLISEELLKKTNIKFYMTLECELTDQKTFETKVTAHFSSKCAILLTENDFDEHLKNAISKMENSAPLL